MNLKKLFEAQEQLDEHIMQEHPELRGQDNLDWKVLALQVELAELAQNWRGFKKWSNDREPRTKIESICGCPMCEHHSIPNDKNPLLEEYVDCLHFILSIGLELGYTGFDELDIDRYLKGFWKGDKEEITSSFIIISYLVSSLIIDKSIYKQVLCKILTLGIKLGLTLEQIEGAYYTKNQTNHKRQEDGY